MLKVALSVLILSSAAMLGLTSGGDPVNDVCPIKGHEIDKDSPTRVFKGHTIGFCCPGCDTKWDAKPEAEKAAFVARYVKIEVPKVETVRVPDGGIQPQAVVGDDGTTHLLYYKGDARAGDIFYVQRPNADSPWSKPRRVNSQAGSAVAMGNDRGGQIALGRNGIVHVAWNGSGKATLKESKTGSPMLYARCLPGKDAFEPQRNVMMASAHLDGGGSVAADSKGNVYVVWHALPLNAKDQAETDRRVFVAASVDDGATFAAEAARSDPAYGACGCCGLKAAALPSGEVLVLYRAARENVNRDMHLLRSTDSGKTFTDAMVDPWELNACPMTTASITPGTSGTVLAWETEQDVRWSLASRADAKTGPVHTVGERGDLRKYPSLAVDAGGRVLLAWTEGMGWNSGGKLRWQVFDARGKPVEHARGEADGVPAWSLVAAIAKPSGGFLIFY